MNGQDRRLMNKFSSDILNRLAKVETKIEERWDAHNDRANEMRDCMNEKFDKIFSRLENLPCKERAFVPRAVYGLYGLCGLILARLVFQYLKGL